MNQELAIKIVDKLEPSDLAYLSYGMLALLGLCIGLVGYIFIRGVVIKTSRVELSTRKPDE